MRERNADFYASLVRPIVAIKVFRDTPPALVAAAFESAQREGVPILAVDGYNVQLDGAVMAEYAPFTAAQERAMCEGGDA